VRILDGKFLVCEGQIKAASSLVLKYHYSHRVPPTSSVLSVTTIHEIKTGLVQPAPGRCLAAVWFCLPPTRWSEPIAELQRLVRREDFQFPLTRLISIGMKQLPKKWDLVVSFADPAFSHHGGIYQAASFHYHGISAGGIDGFRIGSKFVPRRTAFHKWGTSSLSKLKAIIHAQIDPHYDEGKHCYWKALNANGKKKAARLGLKIQLYPKPKLKGDRS
jgi:hypothetical protein